MINCEFENGNKASLRHAVMDTLVLKDGKILLAKRSMKLSEGGKWGLVGGFMERDETLAEGATRETYEETGWEIKNLTMLAIIDNPHHASEDRQNIKFIFFAEGIKQTSEPDWESDEIKWFPLDDLPPKEQIAFDHADSIDLYKSFLRDKPALPIMA